MIWRCLTAFSSHSPQIPKKGSFRHLKAMVINMSETIHIRGVRFDSVSMDEALSRAADFIEDKEASLPFVVHTPNSEIVQLCVEQPAYYPLINSADLIIPDGIGVVMASKILKTPLRKGKVAGCDLGLRIAAYCAERAHGVYFLGGKPGVAELAGERLAEKFPGFSLSGCRDGYFDKSASEENDAVIEAINASGAEVLYVCLGVPAQEKWIFENKERLTHVKLCLALGGSLDVYAGTVKRAPKLFIKLGLEWFWRLLLQPTRIGRMMKLPKFLLGVIIKGNQSDT